LIVEIFFKGICQSSGSTGFGTTLIPGSSIGLGQCAAMIQPAFGQLNYIGVGQTITNGLQQQQFGPFPSGTTVQLICHSGTYSTGNSQVFFKESFFLNLNYLFQAVCTNSQWQPLQLGPCQNNVGLGTTIASIGGVGSCLAQPTPANGQIIYSNVLQSGQTMYQHGTTAALSCLSGKIVNY
jgi:hypothetical protein